MTDDQMQRLHVTIKGYVQGVGFRYFVNRTAGGLGLSGWVRNRSQGTVEVVAEGKRSPLEKLLTALERGPIGSSVRSVHPRWQDATGEFARFRVRRTV
ncbi:MAG: Acylphosphatase [Chloroflexi bacterium]|nr:Acylphosphatase [Chloroflexota bacterium]